MSKKIEYNSVISPYIKEFVTLREAAGYNTRSIKFKLFEIDKFFIDNKIETPTITREIIEKWRESRINDSIGTLHGKYSVWSQLARFMGRNGCHCYVPQLPRYTRSTRAGYAPYVFTHEQIRDIFEKSNDLQPRNRDVRNTLFVFLQYFVCFIVPESEYRRFCLLETQIYIWMQDISIFVKLKMDVNVSSRLTVNLKR